jgi:signal transduction histidine kinase
MRHSGRGEVRRPAADGRGVDQGNLSGGASVVVDLSAHAASLAGTARARSRHLPLGPAPARPLIDQLEAELARFDGHPDTAEAFAAAGERARALAAAGGGGAEATRSAALAYAADALTALKLERALPQSAVSELVSTVASALGCSTEAASLDLFLRAASSPRLLELPPLVTVELQLGLLVALAPVSDVSLWSGGPLAELGCLVNAGDAQPTRRVRHVARATLDGVPDGGVSERGWIHSVPVKRWQQPYAALVARARPDCRERAVVFLEEAAALLAPVLERNMLLERNAARERALVDSGERRLLRLGFDLHDGPIQDLVALATDVRLAGTQVSEHVDGPARELVAGRLEDLTGQIVELDRTLRELAQSLEPTSVLESSLTDVLQREVDSFRARTHIRVALDLAGNLDSLTASQRIALYRIVQESLANVREHSGAKEVQIRVHGGERGTEAHIVDDGRGFEVAKTLIRAAKRGRLGLVGMGERVRLLGGRFDVQSSPGGPTSISLVLPRWQPVAAVELADPALG